MDARLKVLAMKHKQPACWILFLLCIFAGKPVSADDFHTVVSPFLKRYCSSCHGSQKQEANIRYDNLDSFRGEDQHLWTKVHEMISEGDMPPEDQPQPEDSLRRRVLLWIEAEQRSLGTGSTRRLNRREFSAALRDVTGLSVDYADALVGDGVVDGFDTGAEGLQDAASSVGQSMEVTRRAVNGIRFLELPSGRVFAADLSDVKDPRKALDAWKADGASPKTRGFAKPGVGLLIEPKWVGEKGGTSVSIPVSGDGRGVLRLKLLVTAQKHFPGLPNPHLWVEVGGKQIDFRELTADGDQPIELVYEIQLDDLAIEPKGVTIELSGRVELPYAVDGFENEDRTKPDDKIPGGSGLFRPVYNRKAPPEEQPVPFVALQRIEVDPDYVAAWPPAKWNVNVGEIKDSNKDADRLLALWIERAWRRPVAASEQARFSALYRQQRQSGLSFDEALRAAFQSVLLSGAFRYLTSPSDSDLDQRQHSIASRLSFMLVGAPPDDELRRLAATGRLLEPSVLDAQVDRLLADSRSDQFFVPFVTQWLVMDQPITITMDYFQKQDFRFGRFLKQSMRDETISYVAELFRENRPAAELIDSDWTMMNNSLARHYGYDRVTGGRMRIVQLREDDPRGGILGHAGIQSMLCWMGDNWVIYRGAWAMRHILDDPPPPPPLEVPELDPNAGDNRGKSFRELLKQHQENPKCAVCHKSMDPLGFAFQNFDISGRWRDVEYERYLRNELDGKIEWRGSGKTRPVDAAGKLPRGEPFSGFVECKQVLVNHYLDDIVRGILKRLMLYATGRKPDVDDLAEIRQIMQTNSSKQFLMQDLLKSVVRSKAFLEH